MSSEPRVQNGIFLAPFHPVDEDPTLAIQRDLELIEHLDRLGYAEAWIGEHHSAGYEIIASPELFIAAAAERTERIRLGTGVVSLPYHNPLMVANRIIQLDHQTKGRVDARRRPRAAALRRRHARHPGLGPARPDEGEPRGHPRASSPARRSPRRPSWFDLTGAACQLRPYSDPHPEVAVASTVTPHSAKLAGIHDLGLLCVAATVAAGYDALGTNWQIANDAPPTRAAPWTAAVGDSSGRCTSPRPREEAFANVEYGLQKWVDYFSAINPTAAGDDLGAKSPAEAMVDSGRAVIGTPDDAIEQLHRLWEQTGGFGTFLQLAHNWANPENTLKSYELFARHVTPSFNNANRDRAASLLSVTDRGAGADRPGGGRLAREDPGAPRGHRPGAEGHGRGAVVSGPQRAPATELSRDPSLPVPMGPDAPVMDVLATMRAMRRLKPDPVPEELLETLVRAATWAPSGSDAQHYSFVVVTDRARIARLAELWREAETTYEHLAGRVVPDFDDPAHARMAEALRHQRDHFEETPAVIAACYGRSTVSSGGSGGLDRLRGLVRELGWRRLGRLAAGMSSGQNLAEASSIYPAVQNLLLAARAHGLAANMTVWHLFDNAAWRRALGVPKDVGIYAVIPVGWPMGNFGPVRRRPLDDVLHWDRW